jgi:hypothetical protein
VSRRSDRTASAGRKAQEVFRQCLGVSDFIIFNKSCGKLSWKGERTDGHGKEATQRPGHSDALKLTLVADRTTQPLLRLAAAEKYFANPRSFVYICLQWRRGPRTRTGSCG